MVRWLLDWLVWLTDLSRGHKARISSYIRLHTHLHYLETLSLISIPAIHILIQASIFIRAIKRSWGSRCRYTCNISSNKKVSRSVPNGPGRPGFASPRPGSLSGGFFVKPAGACVTGVLVPEICYRSDTRWLLQGWCLLYISRIFLLFSSLCTIVNAHGSPLRTIVTACVAWTWPSWASAELMSRHTAGRA